MSLPPNSTGLVLRVDAKVCHVEIAGTTRQLPLAGKLFEHRTHEKRPVAVGDLVRLDATGEAIDEVMPRTTQLHRRAAGEGAPRRQVIAANITHAFVIGSGKQPPFQFDLVDSVLAAAAREKIAATLVLTKYDVKPRKVDEIAAIYEGIGVPVLRTSTEPGKETPESLDRLRELLHGNRSVFTGPSGAGKSTLLNWLMPGLDLRVGSLSRIRQGKHTTSHTELIALPGGGHVLDTPGVRNFGLYHVGQQELQFLFPEIGSRLEQCEYRNCRHVGEQGCAVRAAVDAGEIAQTRYESYCTLLESAVEDDADYET
ncbi:MAG: ribosome small subunit-dependent GTPase A [bacterium]|nr:ribosome small subunit-dependent GTPase A [bacterium]